MSSHAKVAIFFADQVRAQALAARLETEGMRASVTRNSDEFYQVLNGDRVDLVIVDQNLRGFLSGLEILERLYSDLLRPSTFLLGDLTAELKRRANRLGIDRVMSSQSSIDELLAGARSVLATASFTQVVIPASARRLVSQSDCIQPLPQLIVKLCGYLSDENATVNDVANDISVDPKVTADLLRLTNSSALGRVHKTTCVQEAVNYLGVRGTVSLILSAGMIRAHAGMLRSMPPHFRNWYNHRSVLIAATASAFAENLERASSDTAYVLGLLQDIGVLVLAGAHGERYYALCERVRQIPQLRLEFVENEDFGVSHAEVSAALLQQWELPHSVISLVLNHHQPLGGGDKPLVELAFSRVMQVGEAVANLAECRTPQRFHALNQLLQMYGAERAETCKECLVMAMQKTVESSRLFNVPIPSPEVLDRVLEEIQAHRDSPLLQQEAAEQAQRDEASAAFAPPQTPSSDAAHHASENRRVDEPGEEILHGHDESAAPPWQAGRVNVLVVEDQSAIVRLMRLLLKDEPVNVLSCSGLEEARRFAPQVEAILCDVHLDGENGVQLIRELRDSGYRGKVMMISGDRRRATIQECIELGIDDFLLKPFNREGLVNKLHKHLPQLACAVS